MAPHLTTCVILLAPFSLSVSRQNDRRASWEIPLPHWQLFKLCFTHATPLPWVMQVLQLWHLFAPKEVWMWTKVDSKLFWNGFWNDLVFFDPSVLGFSRVTLYSSGRSWFASIINTIRKYMLGTKQCCQVYFSAAVEVYNYLAIKNWWGHDEVKILFTPATLSWPC